MTEDTRTLVDEERFREVVDYALSIHPQREQVARLLRAGASFYARRNDDGDVEVEARFDHQQEELRELRAYALGEEPAPPPTDEERATVLHILTYPAWGLRAPGQG